MLQPESPHTLDDVRNKLNETLEWLAAFRQSVVDHCDCGPKEGEKIMLRGGWPPDPPPDGLL
jgi:hypothetical protein